jgi:hypothetical protein
MFCPFDQPFRRFDLSKQKDTTNVQASLRDSETGSAATTAEKRPAGQRIRRLKLTVKAQGEQCGAPPDEIDKLLLMEGFTLDSRWDLPTRSGDCSASANPVKPSGDSRRSTEMGIGPDQYAQRFHFGTGSNQ